MLGIHADYPRRRLRRSSDGALGQPGVGNTRATHSAGPIERCSQQLPFQDPSAAGMGWADCFSAPRAFMATSFMPKFELSDDEIKSLVIFLKSGRGMNFAETSLQRFQARVQKTSAISSTPGSAAAEGASAARGEQIVGQRACTACHKLGDKDGRVSPDLN